jgi:hypothetical protein
VGAFNHEGVDLAAADREDYFLRVLDMRLSFVAWTSSGFFRGPARLRVGPFGQIGILRAVTKFGYRDYPVWVSRLGDFDEAGGRRKTSSVTRLGPCWSDDLEPYQHPLGIRQVSDDLTNRNGQIADQGRYGDDLMVSC